MNKVSILNLFQGTLAISLTAVYLKGGDGVRVKIIIFLTILFLTSLLAISSGIKRRRKVVEIFEILIYYLFFGLSFLGINNLKGIGDASSIPPYFWVPCAVGIIFNWGEWIARLTIKLTTHEKEEEWEEEEE